MLVSGLLGLLPIPIDSPLAAEPAPLARLKAVPFTQVRVEDAFWAPRRATNRLASIPVNLEMLEKSGNLRNFELAAAGATNGFTGPVFMDSDVYKALEAAAYSLATDPDPALDRQLETIIATVAKAQQPNGYLDTYFVVKDPGARWKNLRDWHELYCAGHLFEAAVAHYQATGRRSFLDVAVKLANHIDSVFGPGPGQRMGYPGHPEIELALIKLWRVTGDQRYFNLARFFIESRGRHFFAEEHHTPLDRYDGTYWQDDVPICDHQNIKGHAVRAAYLLSGATDVAAETRDPMLLKMLNRVWRNTIQKNMYLTGGIGPSSHNEGFTEDYDLPNLSAYQETCASVALAQWNHRLALLYADSRFADVVERSLYNGVLAGVSLDGTRFFYVNPLASGGSHHRSPWFGCACCPPNVARTLASLGGYVYATSDTALYVNLYVQGSVKTKVGAADVGCKVVTDYPWDGRVTLQPELSAPATFELRLRVPGWCTAATVSVNGQAVAQPRLEAGYLVLAREWRKDDRVVLDLPMPVERIAAHPLVKEDRGLLAIQRGPLVYCLEACDQTVPLADVFVPPGAEFKTVRDARLPTGVVGLTANGAVAEEQEWRGRLYQRAAPARTVSVTAIPYYSWDNRAAGPMRVWLPTVAPIPPAGGLEREAKVSVSFANSNSQPEGVNDGREPASSGDQPPQLLHWWPHNNSTEWAQYTWKRPVTVGGARVYWFDDTGRGACRIPAAWHVEYLDGSEWKPVSATSDYPVKVDAWCAASFKPVTTTSLRLSVKLPEKFAAGVQEWKVVEVEEE